VYKNPIVINFLSNFSYEIDGSIVLNKHRIDKIEAPKTRIENVKEFYCPHCGCMIPLKNTLVLCDDCKLLVKFEKIDRLGKSVTLCKTCSQLKKEFMQFLIFNEEKPPIYKFRRDSEEGELRAVRARVANRNIGEFPVPPINLDLNVVPDLDIDPPEEHEPPPEELPY
jgi:hypothetical protein